MKTMSDFEVCPVGTAKRLAELEKMLAARPEPVRCKDLNVGDRVRMMTDWTGVVTGTALSLGIVYVRDDTDGIVEGVNVGDDGETTAYLLERPDTRPEPLAEYLHNVVSDLVDDDHLAGDIVADIIQALREPDAPPVKESELVTDEALVKVIVDWVRNPHYISISDEDYARELVRRLYAKAVQL